jgi:hypothetical protein
MFAFLALVETRVVVVVVVVVSDNGGGHVRPQVARSGVRPVVRGGRLGQKLSRDNC